MPPSPRADLNPTDTASIESLSLSGLQLLDRVGQARAAIVGRILAPGAELQIALDGYVGTKRQTSLQAGGIGSGPMRAFTA